MLIFKRYTAFVVFELWPFPEDGCPLEAKWHGCAKGRKEEMQGGKKHLFYGAFGEKHCEILLGWLWFTCQPSKLKSDILKMMLSSPHRTESQSICFVATSGCNENSLPENPESQTHLKEAGDTWTHVPFSQILSQFCLPTTSEQLTPEMKIN